MTELAAAKTGMTPWTDPTEEEAADPNVSEIELAVRACDPSVQLNVSTTELDPVAQSTF